MGPAVFFGFVNLIVIKMSFLSLHDDGKQIVKINTLGTKSINELLCTLIPYYASGSSTTIIITVAQKQIGIFPS